MRGVSSSKNIPPSCRASPPGYPRPIYTRSKEKLFPGLCEGTEDESGEAAELERQIDQKKGPEKNAFFRNISSKREHDAEVIFPRNPLL